METMKPREGSKKVTGRHESVALKRLNADLRGSSHVLPFFWIVLHLISILFLLCLLSSCAQADTGIATWYSVKSTKSEGNTGITASGEKLNEASFTAALRSYHFGKRYKVTNLKTGKSIVVKHNDFGPGKKPTKRGVIIDLTPGAFDALGGVRGKNWGEFPVSVEVMP